MPIYLGDQKIGVNAKVAVGNQVDWDDIYGKPAEFPPSQHQHSEYYPKSETSSAVEIKTAFEGIDQTNFYKKSETSSAIEISNALSQKASISDIPVNVSQLNNDAGYTTNIGTITEIMMNGVSKGTLGPVNLGTVLTAHQSLDGYALTSQIPTKTSQLTNDSNFLTAHQSLTAYETKADLTSNYYQKTDVTLNSSGVLKIGNTQITALTAHQSLDNYVQKNDSDYKNQTYAQISSGIHLGDYAKSVSIPTKTSQLTNDSGFLTAHQSLDNYYLKSQTSSAVQLESKFGNYVQLGNSEYKNQTYAQISSGIHLGDYAKTTSIPTVNNGTLTIQVNGTTLKTFSANQSENTTANLSVVTGIKMNGSSKGSSGIVDLGTVLTAHQSLTAYATTQYVDTQIGNINTVLEALN